MTAKIILKVIKLVLDNMPVILKEAKRWEISKKHIRLKHRIILYNRIII
jgi:hypothetical protein